MNNDEKLLIAYCGYCLDPIFEGEGMIQDKGVYYHYDKTNPLLNCYFPEDVEDED